MGTESAAYTKGKLRRPCARPPYPLESFWDFTVPPLAKTGMVLPTQTTDEASNGSLHQAYARTWHPHRTPHPPHLSADRCVWFPTRCPTTRTKTGPPEEVRRTFGRGLGDTGHPESGCRWDGPKWRLVRAGGTCQQLGSQSRVRKEGAFPQQREWAPCPGVCQQGHKKPKDLCVTNGSL